MLQVGSHLVSVTGHRGNAEWAPENTMCSFEQALDLGVDALETDVRLSKDRVPFLFHDASLERITGTARAANSLTMDELRSLDAGSWKGSAHRGQGIPDLVELAELCRGRARLVLDLKVEDAAGPIAEALRVSGLPRDAVSICAWNDRHARDVGAHLEGVDLRFSTEQPLPSCDERWFEEMKAKGYRGLSIDWNLLHEEIIQLAHAQQVRVVTWTVNEPEEMARALASGVDEIITDDPGGLIALHTGPRSP